MRNGNTSFGKAIMKYGTANPGMYIARRVDVHVNSAKKAGRTPYVLFALSWLYRALHAVR